MKKSKDVTMLKLIKEYLLHNPYSTARQISEHFIINDFGIKKDYTTHEIRTLISMHTSNTSNTHKWFNINTKKRNNKQVYYIPPTPQK